MRRLLPGTYTWDCGPLEDLVWQELKAKQSFGDMLTIRVMEQINDGYPHVIEDLEVEIHNRRLIVKAHLEDA